jgi:hypothetical protein
MLRKGRFRDFLLSYVQEGGAIVGAVGTDEVGIDRDTDRVSQSVKNTLDGNILERRVKKRPHTVQYRLGLTFVQ